MLVCGMPTRPRKTPADVNSNAVRVARIATGEAEAPRKKNPAAVALGRLGASKGGNARAAALSPKERSKIAKLAAARRWERMLYPVDHDGGIKASFVTATQALPDGTFMPRKETDQGDVEAACSNCGAPLARYFTVAALAKCLLRCSHCGQFSVGKDHPARTT
jgi:hypothetical protein